MSSRTSVRRSSLASQPSLFTKRQSKSALASGSKGGLTSSSRTSHHGWNSLQGMKKGGVACIPEEKLQKLKKRPKSTETIRFIYSTSVIRAFKRDYNVTQFGPPSAGTLFPRHNIQIVKLPEMYADFKQITELLESNQQFIEKLRAEMEAAGEIMPMPTHLPLRERGGSKLTNANIKRFNKNFVSGLYKEQPSRTTMLNTNGRNMRQNKFPAIS